VYTFPTRYLPPRSSVAIQDSSVAKVFTVAESPIQHPEIKRTRLRLIQGGSTSHRKCERPGNLVTVTCPARLWPPRESSLMRYVALKIFQPCRSIAVGRRPPIAPR
jgi:hypothetical protein